MILFFRNAAIANSILVLAFGIAEGKTVVIRAPHADPIEFLAHIRSDPEAESFLEWSTRQAYAESAKTQLRNLFAEAQTAFLEADTPTMQMAFNRVTGLATAWDWETQERDIVMMSYLRLAQIEPDPVTKEAILTEAARFHPTYDADKSLFPPPLLRTFDEIKASRALMALEEKRKLNIQGFERLLINGVSYNTDDALSIPMGVARFTYLSSAFQKQTRVLNGRDFLRWVPEERAIADGTCSNSDFSKVPKKILSSATIFYSSQCRLTAGSRPSETANPIQTGFGSSPGGFNSLGANPKPQWTQNAVLKWGVAAIGAYLLIEANRQNDDSPRRPVTHKDGF